jgi:hypothetical protein
MKYWKTPQRKARNATAKISGISVASIKFVRSPIALAICELFMAYMLAGEYQNARDR